MSKKRILGIDPGLNRTGFGVIDADGSRLTFVTAGCIHVPTGTLSERLGTIFRELSAVIAETNPDCAAAEQVFVNINPRSTLLLGTSPRCRASLCGTPRSCGSGIFTVRNQKFDCRHRSSHQDSGTSDGLNPFEAFRRHSADAADALACAVTHAHAMQLTQVQAMAAVPSRTGNRTMTSKKSKRNAWAQLVNNKIRNQS